MERSSHSRANRRLINCLERRPLALPTRSTVGHVRIPDEGTPALPNQARILKAAQTLRALGRRLAELESGGPPDRVAGAAAKTATHHGSATTVEEEPLTKRSLSQ